MADEVQDPQAEYPKMLFKKGAPTGEHQLENQPLAIAGVKGLGYAVVHSLDEERAHIAEGYHLTPALDEAPRRVDARDAEIEKLKRQLEEATAPPKPVTPAPKAEKV